MTFLDSELDKLLRDTEPCGNGSTSQALHYIHVLALVVREMRMEQRRRDCEDIDAVAHLDSAIKHIKRDCAADKHCETIGLEAATAEEIAQYLDKQAERLGHIGQGWVRDSLRAVAEDVRRGKWKR